MNYAPIAGLIVLSFMTLILFWKLIQVNYVEKAFLTILAMIGFFAGLGWSGPVMIFLYTKSSPKSTISKLEWMTCVCTLGILTLVGFVGGLAFSPNKAPFQIGLFVYCVLAVIGSIAYCSSEERSWED